eukprot:7369161-Alexandrium_andersonii.AAC.1
MEASDGMLVDSVGSAECDSAMSDLEPLVFSWPVAYPDDACGCAVRQRMEEWARAQARWLGPQVLASRAPGTDALLSATLWVVASRAHAGMGPPQCWNGWTMENWALLQRQLDRRLVASPLAVASRMRDIGLPWGLYVRLSWDALSHLAGEPVCGIFLRDWQTSIGSGSDDDRSRPLLQPPAPLICLARIAGRGEDCVNGLGQSEAPPDGARFSRALLRSVALSGDGGTTLPEASASLAGRRAAGEAGLGDSPTRSCACQ